MVINDLNICHSLLSPDEADAPLIIYTNTVLAGAIASQRFQTIAGR
ncbi:plasmid maintenance system killer domain protein [Collimonas fungivorans]|uniref:Plasmid maintenance system killer domain protein n=1 Tax=Collimonas fungivorans TaxID=158899 RepID=A0A127PG65_9BURK|nr:plasmid maintenance system killer domain protein [Collimonas fungivorans]